MAKSHFLFFLITFVASFNNAIVLGRILLQNNDNSTEIYDTKTRCDIPKTAPKNIENAITECQLEIQVALLADAFELVGETEEDAENNKQESSSTYKIRKTRSADEFFSEDEQKIAGCLLQCVYRKMKAVNEFGFPKVDGLVTLYTEGVTDPEYIKGTFQAVNSCLGTAKKKFATSLNDNNRDDGTTCDVAFYTFDCISDHIDDYCKQKP